VRKNQAKNLIDFPAELSSVRAEIKAVKLIDSEIAHRLSRRLCDLAFATVNVDPMFRYVYLEKIEQISDGLTARTDVDVFWGRDSVFGAIVRGGIGNSLLSRDGLGGQQIATFRRCVDSIDRRLVNQPVIATEKGNSVFLGGVPRADGSAHMPEMLAFAITILADVIGVLEKSRRIDCAVDLLKRAERYLRRDHPPLYRQATTSVARVISRIQVPLSDASNLRQDMQAKAKELQSQYPDSSRILLEAATTSIPRRVLEQAAAKASTIRKQTAIKVSSKRRGLG
jgi:hypothetical protein